jgi:5-methylcytosine-specific restriction protein A
MASRRPCPGCRVALITRGQRCCSACDRAYEQRRGSPSARGYDAEWQRLRRAYLAEHPSCGVCGGAATEVDHIVSVRQRPDLRLVPENWRPRCRPCHSRRTAKEQAWLR